MSEKRFIRNITGDIYDSETDKWFDEDWKDKPLDYDDDLIIFLNEQQATIEELRLQEKEKGVPVFVVREGKNPVAMFFNEQMAMYYCQEHMAHLTYQQEKWCRVE